MMNIERLRLMSEMLGEVIAGTWKPTSKVQPILRSMPIEGNVGFEMRSWFGLTPDYCGYSACAVGHACLDERFNRLGLVFDDGPTYVGPDGEEYAPSWEGVCEFFGIGQSMAEMLFSDSSYLDMSDAANAQWTRDGSRPPVLPAQVKERIDQLIGIIA
jgi:hypothetical protein